MTSASAPVVAAHRVGLCPHRQPCRSRRCPTSGVRGQDGAGVRHPCAGRARGLLHRVRTRRVRLLRRL